MRYLVVCLAVVAGLMSSPVLANSHGGIYANLSTQTGYELQPLLHGQLLAMDTHRPAIVALAQQVMPDDAMAQTLITYIGEQRSACAYGIFPADWAGAEYSPLHLCTHGFLAGTQALLAYLNDKAGERLDVQQLYNQVLADGGIGLCAYSTTRFNTNDIVHVDLPHGDFVHSGTVVLLAFGVLLLFLGRKRPAMA